MQRTEWMGVLEVLAVTLLGLALAALGPALLSLPMHNPLAGLHPAALPESWLPLAWPALKLLLVQYGSLFLVLGVFMALARRRPGRLGLSRGGQPVSRLLVLAGLAAIVVFPPVRGLLEAGQVWNLAASGPPWREALLSAPLTWDFYVFMAVLSYGVVPVVEEIFYRGYVQGRLQQVMGSSMLPIVLTSVLFTFLHSQYLGLDAYSLATIALLFGLSMVLGLLYRQTGSLLPSILVHALINLPMSSGVILGVGGMLVVAGVLGRAALAAWLVGTLAMIGTRRPATSQLLSIGLMLGTALLLAFRPAWALCLGPVYLLAYIALARKKREVRVGSN